MHCLARASVAALLAASAQGAEARADEPMTPPAVPAPVPAPVAPVAVPAVTPTPAPGPCQVEAKAHEQTKGREALLALAECHQKAGKLATAWRLFDALAGEARAASDADQETIARERVAALAPRVPKLRVEVVGAVPEVRIEVDGITLEPKRYGVAEPIDPGDHVVRVFRGDAQIAKRDVVLVEMGRETMSLDVEALTRAHAESQKQPPTPPAPAAPGTPNQMPADLDDKASSSSDLAWMTPLGSTLIGVGTVAGLTFVGLELSALALAGNADCTTLRDDTSLCTAGGFEQLDTGRSLAEAGQWTGVAGAIVLAAGIAFAVAAPGEAPSPPRAWVAPTFGRGFGVLAGGTL